MSSVELMSLATESKAASSAVRSATRCSRSPSRSAQFRLGLPAPTDLFHQLLVGQRELLGALLDLCFELFVHPLQSGARRVSARRYC